MRVAIIGGGAAGMSCASRIKALAPDVQVSVFERTSLVSHAPCGIPYVVEGFSDVSKLVHYPPSFFIERRGIDLHLNSEVVEVEEGVLRYREENSEKKFEWDVLVFSTGALPRVPEIEGIELEGVLTVSHPADTPKILREVERAEKLVIVGAGYMGVEMTEALVPRGKRVTIIEMLDRPLPNFSREISEVLRKEMESRVDLRFNESVQAIEGDERVRRVVGEKGEYETDAAIIATGVKPNVELASQLDVKLGVTGAIEVDERMRTSAENVYAAGDCAETWNLITGEKTWVPLATYANKMGYVAGVNIAGGSLSFPGILGTQITKFFDLQIARTGLSEGEAENLGFKPESSFISAKTKPKYYPDTQEIHVKLLCDGESRRLLGAEIAGYDSVFARICSAALAIQAGFRVEDLFFSEIPYAPPFSTVWDPLIVAARKLGIRKR